METNRRLVLRNKTKTVEIGKLADVTVFSGVTVISVAAEDYPIVPRTCCATCSSLKPVMQSHIRPSGEQTGQISGWQCVHSESPFGGRIILNKNQAWCDCHHYMFEHR